MKKYTKKTKFIVFVTTNTANHKSYVGIHTTDDPSKFDGYVGQVSDHTQNTGRAALSRDIKKFGIDKFHRIDLAIFDTAEEAQTLYNSIVTENFVNRKTVYNNRYQEDTTPSRKIIQYTLDGKFVKI